MADSNGISGGIGFMGALLILFIGLKLGGVIDWPWLWVLAPAWWSIAFAMAVCTIVCVVAVTLTAIDSFNSRRRRRRGW